MFFSFGEHRLLVRTTLPELDKIENAIQVLNTPPPQILIKARFVETADALGPDRFGHALIQAASNGLQGAWTAVLTDPQFRVVLRSLEQREGTDLLTAPRVTTLSGRQARIQSVDPQEGVAISKRINPRALVPPG